MKACIIIGTRPEIIKLTPIIRYCESNNLSYFILHTGQHYSINLDKLFFQELELPIPKYNLEIGSSFHGKQTGMMLEEIEKVLQEEKPSVVLVEGDTNSVFAGALAAVKLHIPVGHVEAGLRSYNKGMPEEINRILTDHISDFLFCPTEVSKKTALKEGISEEKIFLTGNTIVDSVQQNLQIAKEKSEILRRLNLTPDNYFLVTVHRQENVDDREKLKSILEGFGEMYQIFNIPVVLPIHPRTKKQIEFFSLNVPEGLSIIEPVGFLDFLQLEAKARLILTDSGGVQEEACILKVPCVTLREDTERPETISVGANILAGTDKTKIIECVKGMLTKERSWKNPLGEGNAAEKIINIILNYKTHENNYSFP